MIVLLLCRGGGRGSRVEATGADCSTFALLRRRCLVLCIIGAPLRRPHGSSLVGFDAQFHGDQCAEFQKPCNKVYKVSGPMILPSQERVVLLRAGRQPGSNPAPVLPSGHRVRMTSGEGSNNWLPGCLAGTRRRHTYRASGIEVTGTTRRG